MRNRNFTNKQAPFAVIFDMDGVLIDNLSYHVKSWQQFARNHGATLGKADFFQRLNGRTARDTIVRILHRRDSKAETEKFANEKERIYRQLYRAHRKLLPGLIPLLKILRNNKVPCALATSAPPENIPFILGDLKIRRYFNKIVDANGVKYGKPAPDIFLKAAHKLRIKPERCIVFEDALLGITAAKRAGMKVVGVATSHSIKELGHADLVIKEFNKLSLQKLASLLEKS